MIDYILGIFLLLLFLASSYCVWQRQAKGKKSCARCHGNCSVSCQKEEKQTRGRQHE